MTIDEAIKILRYILNEQYNFYADEQKTAVKMGAAALVRIQVIRQTGEPGIRKVLPGETR